MHIFAWVRRKDFSIEQFQGSLRNGTVSWLICYCNTNENCAKDYKHLNFLRDYGNEELCVSL